MILWHAGRAGLLRLLGGQPGRNMRVRKVVTSLGALMAVAAAGVLTAPAAQAADHISRTAEGGRVSAFVYQQTGVGLTVSGVLNDTVLNDNRPTTLQVRSQVWGDSEWGPADNIGWTYDRYQGPLMWLGTSFTIRLQLRVCSYGCSSWQTTPWYKF